MTFIFPTDTKDDFTAENGVTYSWVEPSHWRVKSFKSPDGQTVIVDDDPPEHKEGQLWFCTKGKDLTLYISFGGDWVPASPPVSLDGIESDIQDIDMAVDQLRNDIMTNASELQSGGQRLDKLEEAVDKGVRDQTTLRSRVGDVEYVAENALPKAGGTMTGNLEFKCKGEKEYWSYIKALRPAAWDKENKTHGLILDIGTSNTYKQQFKIHGRGGKTLFNIFDDGTASAQISGRLNCTGDIKIDGRYVATQDWVDERIGDFGGGDGATARHGNEQNPMLNTGELYLRTTDNVLLVGL